MNANDVIESYVTDVAVRLPRKQRNDVAFELRALLNEELQAKADAAGRGVDDAMALELVRAFGPPADVAARYRPTLTIIDPADGYAFVRMTLIGLGVIWSLGLWVSLQQRIDSGWDVLTALGHWWGTTVIPSLWWPGVLVVGFGGASWSRRRRPQVSDWKPRSGMRTEGSRGEGSRAAMVAALVGILCGVAALNDPRWFLDLFFGGRAAPAVYQAFTYTDTFLQRQAPYLRAVLMLHVPLLVTVIATGQWWELMRRVRNGLSLLTATVLAWIVLDGPVFMAPSTDRAIKGFMVLTVVMTLVNVGIALYRRVRPAPSEPMPN